MHFVKIKSFAITEEYQELPIWKYMLSEKTIREIPCLECLYSNLVRHTQRNSDLSMPIILVKNLSSIIPMIL